jgi:hypothetical protein
MMIDSAFIIDLASGDLSSTNSIAKLHITKRQHEEHYRDHDKDHVLHTTSSVLTSFAGVNFAWVNKANKPVTPAIVD